MAVAWEVTPRFLNKERTRAAITAVATDDANPDNPVTVNILNTVVGTKESEDALWVEVKRLYAEQQADPATSAANDLAASGKVALETI